MYLLSVDPGVVNTGLAILNSNSIIKSQTYVCREEFLPKKLFNYSGFLLDFCSEYRIETLVYENPYFALKGNNYVIMERMIGVLLYTVFSINNNIIVDSYSAKEVKKRITGNGESNKTVLQEYIQKAYPDCKYDSNHSSDAICIGLTFLKSKNYV